MPRKYVECLFYLFLMCLMVSLCVFLLTTPLRPPKTEEWSEIRVVVVVGMVVHGGWGGGEANKTEPERMWVHVLVVYEEYG